MCGRYFIDEDDSIFSSLPGKKGEILPSDLACVYLREGKIKSDVKQWGFLMSNKKLLINARSETASSKLSFCQLIHSSRLLVPATLYYEYDAGKTKHSLGVSSNRMYMAGLFNDNRFVILTAEAASVIKHIHNRMPVILDHENAMRWLDTSCKPDEIISTALIPEVLV